MSTTSQNLGKERETVFHDTAVAKQNEVKQNKIAQGTLPSSSNETKAVGEKAATLSVPLARKPRKQPPSSLTVPHLDLNVSHSSGKTRDLSLSGTDTGTKSKYRSQLPVKKSKPSSSTLKNSSGKRRDNRSGSESSNSLKTPNTYTQSKEPSDEDNSLEEVPQLFCTSTSQTTPSHSKSSGESTNHKGKRGATPKTPRKSPKPFEQYLPLEEVQRGLKKGELIEGVLRINPKSYEDAYISAPDGRMDIYIGGILDRNRALNGDVVVVKLHPQAKWKTLMDNIRDYESKYDIFNALPPQDSVFEDPGLKSLIPFEQLSISSALTDSMSNSDRLEKKKTRRGKRGRKKKPPLDKATPGSLDENLELNACNDDAGLDVGPEPENVSVVVKETLKKEATSKNKKCRHPQKNRKKSASSIGNEVMPTNGWCSASSNVCDPIFVAALKSLSTSLKPNSKENNCTTPSASDIAPVNEKIEEEERILVVAPHELSETEERGSTDQSSLDGSNLQEVADSLDCLNLMDADLNKLPIINNSNSACVSDKVSQIEDKSHLCDTVDACATIHDSNTGSNTNNSAPQSIQSSNNNGSDSYPETETRKVSLSQLPLKELLKHPMAHKFIQKTGKVVYLMTAKHARKAAGHLKPMQDKNLNWSLFVPKDSRIPRMMIPMNQCPAGFLENAENIENFLFLGKLYEWPNSGLAKGQLLCCLGGAGLIEAETNAILLENDIDFTDFPSEVTHSLHISEQWTIPKEEFAYRRDLRDECIFTIDPETARDMDDAMSCQENEDGTYVVGVHIADVSYFVRENTPVDKVAASRTTTVYLVQMAIPMLPRVLCERLCSLAPAEDRLCMSVMWHLDKDGNVLKEWFGRTVIRSCIKLNYNHAQIMIEEPSKSWTTDEHPPLSGGFTITDVATRVQLLHNLAKKLLEKRMQSGALRLDQTKLHFTFSEGSPLPATIEIYKRKDSHSLIEEFMLLANMAVGLKILRAFPEKAVLRCHPHPVQLMMEEAADLCATVGIHLDIESTHGIQQKLEELRGKDYLGEAVAAVLTHILSKPMQRAQYFCSGYVDDESSFHHYALNVPVYTHFTSPIRRYPDIMVHRLLGACLGYNPEPKGDILTTQKLAERCNDKKYAAKIAQEQSGELFLSLYIKEHGFCEEEAIVLGILDQAFDVLVLNMGIVKRIYCKQLPVNFEFHKERGACQLVLDWNEDDNHKATRQTITILTLVRVKLKSGKEPLKIMAELNRPQELVDVHQE